MRKTRKEIGCVRCRHTSRDVVYLSKTCTYVARGARVLLFHACIIVCGHVFVCLVTARNNRILRCSGPPPKRSSRKMKCRRFRVRFETTKVYVPPVIAPMVVWKKRTCFMVCDNVRVSQSPFHTRNRFATDRERACHVHELLRFLGHVAQVPVCP